MEKLNDLISRSALLKDGIRAEHGLNEDGILYIPLRDVTRSIENAPAVEAEPVVHAYWEFYEDETGGWWDKCSRCGGKLPNHDGCCCCLPRCPERGAHMDRSGLR